MSRSVRLAVAALAMLLTACGDETADREGASPRTQDEAPFVMTAEGEIEVSCGGDDGWPPSVMADGLPGVLDDDEAREIFERILNDPQAGVEAELSLFKDGVDVEWRVLDHDDDSIMIGLGRWTAQGPEGSGTYYLGLERQGDAWRAGGWGDCTLSPVLKDGLTWVEVTEARGELTDTTLSVDVHERECTSGRDPGPFLHEPYVVETADAVTIYWTSEPAAGDQNCQGNPSVERSVELESPLGTRTVFDGFSYPPRALKLGSASP